MPLPTPTTDAGDHNASSEDSAFMDRESRNTLK